MLFFAYFSNANSSSWNLPAQADAFDAQHVWVVNNTNETKNVLVIPKD